MRGRVSLRGRRARASEGPSFVCFESRDRPSTRRAALASWVRWTVNPRSMLREAAVTVPACPRRPSASVYSRRRSNRCTSGGARRAPRDVAAVACPLHGQVRQEPPGAPDGRVERLPPSRRGRRRRAGQLVRIGAGLRRGVDVTASRCFSWPVRSAPSVASKADATLGCYSNSAFFFAVDPQVVSISLAEKIFFAARCEGAECPGGGRTRAHGGRNITTRRNPFYAPRPSASHGSRRTPETSATDVSL